MADDKQKITHPSSDRFKLGAKGQADLERTYGWRKEVNREKKPSDPDGDGDVDSPLDQLMIKRRGYVQQIFKKIIDEEILVLEENVSSKLIKFDKKREFEEGYKEICVAIDITLETLTEEELAELDDLIEATVKLDTSPVSAKPLTLPPLAPEGNLPATIKPPPATNTNVPPIDRKGATTLKQVAPGQYKLPSSFTSKLSGALKTGAKLGAKVLGGISRLNPYVNVLTGITKSTPVANAELPKLGTPERVELDKQFKIDQTKLRDQNIQTRLSQAPDNPPLVKAPAPAPKSNELAKTDTVPALAKGPKAEIIPQSQVLKSPAPAVNVQTVPQTQPAVAQAPASPPPTQPVAPKPPAPKPATPPEPEKPKVKAPSPEPVVKKIQNFRAAGQGDMDQKGFAGKTITGPTLTAKTSSPEVSKDWGYQTAKVTGLGGQNFKGSVVNQNLKVGFGKKNESINEVKTMSKHDPVGQEDKDINNDKKVDSTDSYLHNRRAAIAGQKGNKTHAQKLIALARAAREGK